MSTLGEMRIRVSFNPSNNDKVQKLKEQFADLLNKVNELETTDVETGRLKSLALTSLEESAMWTVKLITS